VDAHRGHRQPASSGHALALARWEENSSRWLDGGEFELTSNTTDLQDLVGDGGTLWVVVSRRVNGRAQYALSLRLEKCRRRTYRSASVFGKFSVIGDSARSVKFATNDASWLLLGLRFDPPRPIDHRRDRMRVIGPSLQRPRALSRSDVALLTSFAREIGRWSVFVSYKREDASAAERLVKELSSRGVSAFRDQDSIRGGDPWWDAIEGAIKRSRRLVVIVGKRMAALEYVTRELAVARRSRVPVIPLLTDGDEKDLQVLGIAHLNALPWSPRSRIEAVDDIIRQVYGR
jgi:hypothetical protein